MITVLDDDPPRCFERPLAVVLSRTPERRALVARALAQYATVAAVGMGSLGEVLAVARGVVLSVVVLDGVGEHELHDILGALRAQGGAKRALIITCISSAFASSLSDFVLPAEVGPNQIAAKARQALDALRAQRLRELPRRGRV
jgi:hypothetical protein